MIACTIPEILGHFVNWKFSYSAFGQARLDLLELRDCLSTSDDTNLRINAIEPDRMRCGKISN